MYKTLTLFAALCGLASGAQALDNDKAVRDALLSLVPGAKIDSIAEAAIPGFYEVVTSGQVVYISTDGKYLLQGTLYDIPAKSDLTELRRGGIRAEALNRLQDDKRIIFAAEKPKHTVSVFTDIDCGYCRRLHQQVPEYNKLGISIEYLFFPRAGVGSPSYDKVVSVWCAKDRGAALTAAKNGTDPEAKTCDNPIAEEFEIGRAIGVSGTPAIIAADGTQIGGYVPPEQMLMRLDELAAKAAGDKTASK